MSSGGRVDLDGGGVVPLTICMIGAGGFIGSHLCEKLTAETPDVVLAVDVYSDKIRHLVDPPPPHLAGRISFHRLNVKNDPRLEGLVKMADLVAGRLDLPLLREDDKPGGDLHAGGLQHAAARHHLQQLNRRAPGGQVLLGEWQASDPLLHV